jgi:hypothetical protein
METATKLQEWLCRDGITDWDWRGPRQISQKYLRVFFISDISTYDGQRITDWARKGMRKGGRKSS